MSDEIGGNSRTTDIGPTAPTREAVKCPRCLGCGQIADSEDGEPWSYWLDLPLRSAAAVTLGLVKPIPCPACSEVTAS